MARKHQTHSPEKTLPTHTRTAMSDVTLNSCGDLVTMYIDGAESSALDLSDPTHLEFEYMQHILCAVSAVLPEVSPLRALHLGAAGCALARAIDAMWQARQLAIEIDPELAQQVRQWFDLPPAPRLRIRAQDARITLDTNSGSWHVIIRDTFHNGQVPQHLRTIQAHAHAARLLTEDGVYCVNIADRNEHNGIAPALPEIRAIGEVFPHLLAIADPAILKNRRHGNLVVIAAHRPLPHDAIQTAIRRCPLPARILKDAELRRRAEHCELLTDQAIGWPFPSAQ
ncbi:spermidine synthase [Trueperella sp. LYQ143]|uniref:spermidine synthase n=1 Tax=unclassified Trueperella TaxID=2630174 RepID=UPI003982EF92